MRMDMAVFCRSPVMRASCARLRRTAGLRNAASSGWWRTMDWAMTISPAMSTRKSSFAVSTLTERVSAPRALRSPSLLRRSGPVQSDVVAVVFQGMVSVCASRSLHPAPPDCCNVGLAKRSATNALQQCQLLRRRSRVASQQSRLQSGQPDFQKVGRGQYDVHYSRM